MKVSSARFFAAVFLLLISATSCFAEIYSITSQVTPTAIAKPFADDSIEAKKQLAQIVKLQQNVDKNELKKAKEEADLEVQTLLLAVDGKLTKKSYPAFYAMLENVMETSDKISEDTKNYWQRKRPYLLDDKVKVLLSFAPRSYAYPSGHTNDSYVMAYVASMLMPQKAKQFVARAEEIAQHRVLVGVHFPRDLEGGRELSKLIFVALKNNAEFKADFAKAEEEVKSKR